MTPIETTVRPATPEASIEVRQLVRDGWTVSGRSHGQVRLWRHKPRATDDTAEAETPADEVPADEVPADEVVRRRSLLGAALGANGEDRESLTDIVGARQAAVLDGHGYGTLADALTALADDPHAFAALADVGEVTIAKLARAAELRDSQ